MNKYIQVVTDEFSNQKLYVKDGKVFRSQLDRKPNVKQQQVTSSQEDNTF